MNAVECNTNMRQNARSPIHIILSLLLFLQAARFVAADEEWPTMRSFTLCASGEVLGDGRRAVGGMPANEQCRVSCQSPLANMNLTDAELETAINAGYATSTFTKPSGCERTMLSEDLLARSSHRRGSVCIPRGDCIKTCAIQEPYGCVFSGSCAHLVCVRNSSDYFGVVTHAGPASKLGSVHDDPVMLSSPTVSSDDASTNKDNQTPLPLSDVLLRGVDDCNYNGAYPTTLFRAFTNDFDLNSEPFVDLTTYASAHLSAPFRQCRAYVSAFNTSALDLEIVRVMTGCNFCKKAAAKEYVRENVTISGNSLPFQSMCIPTESCEKQCDRITPPGCVYSGTCESLVCLSSRVSKQPVNFTKVSQDGSPASPVLHASSPASQFPIDPPVFNMDNESALLQSARPSYVPLGSTNDSVNPIASEEPSDSMIDASINPSENPAVCIAVHHLQGLSLQRDQLVYPSHQRAYVLCDAHENCATPGHVVLWEERPMTMLAYCKLPFHASRHDIQSRNQNSVDVFRSAKYRQSASVISSATSSATFSVPSSNAQSSCTRKIMHVNSPKFKRALRIESNSKHLKFTSFAAAYGTRLEEILLRIMVRIGL